MYVQYADSILLYRGSVTNARHGGEDCVNLSSDYQDASRGCQPRANQYRSAPSTSTRRLRAASGVFVVYGWAHMANQETIWLLEMVAEWESDMQAPRVRQGMVQYRGIVQTADYEVVISRPSGLSNDCYPVVSSTVVR